MLKRGKLRIFWDPFYSTYNVGPYTYSPYKVVWANIASDIKAAVVSQAEERLVIPEHVVTLVPFEDENEAHYVCALLNSSPANYTVKSYSTKGGKSFGTPHVLDHIRIKYFDPTNPTHREMALLSQQAHAHVNDVDQIWKIEAEIDKLAAQLWGLTDDELREIQESLEELG
jgi:hypothetical protein